MSGGDVLLKIINLEHRYDRKAECLAELSLSGITADDDSFFKAYYKPEFGELGASLSHANLIARYLSESVCPYLLVFEDDFEIINKDDFLADLNKALCIADRWDVFLLSHNQAIPVSIIDKKAGFYRVINSQTASGYIVKREFASRLMAVFFDSVTGLQNTRVIGDEVGDIVKIFYCLDMLWKNLQTGFNFVAHFPAYVKQRPSYSDIENKHVDYGV
ncbi:hypothetical protein GCM10009414_22270 [Tatumella terrea]|uniref:hypothetical protein n=1 Tax=Tatumella terrea TaxID=419007 RepID=UPI0031D02253